MVSVRDTGDRTSLLYRFALTSRLLAWSSQGTIAFAPPLSEKLSPSNPPGDIYGHATRLYATTPSIDVPSKRSSLLNSVAQPIPPVDNIPIDYIMFNELALFLAVVDELGTITIWEQDAIATQLIHRQPFPADPEDNGGEPSGRIVALRWLHTDSKFHVAVKLAKSGDQWNCQSNSQKGSGPCNTVGKEALIAITSDGKVSASLSLIDEGKIGVSNSEGLEDGDFETRGRRRR